MFRKELAEALRKFKSDNEIYHDLIPFKVREILLVTTVYDAFILEQEDQLTEEIFGEYYSLSVSTAPRITSATYGEEALELLGSRQFDMVILTMRIIDMSPFELCSRMKTINGSIPIFLLLYDNNEIYLLGEKREHIDDFEKVFVWNRDSKIFLTMVKYIEDKFNVDNDTKIGLVRVILLVENSIRYYSRYLPTLYNEILMQTKRVIRDEHGDEMKKLVRMNARPKVLIAVNYEEAVDIFEKYKDYLLCVISDVRFPREGKIEENAGVELVKYVKNYFPDLPTVLQSSDPENQIVAQQYRSFFINKNSESLSSDLRHFIFNNLGFGDFIFRNSSGEMIERASNMTQFRKVLRKIPFESLFFHANRNHFSAWLMARGEIRIAKELQPVKVTDFSDAQGLRNYLIEVFENVNYQNIKGKIIEYGDFLDEAIFTKENYLIRLAEGSLGGKGRGIAFINTMIQNIDIASSYPDISIKIPRTVVIGTNEYDSFLNKNKLNEYSLNETNFEALKKKFLKSNLSRSLRYKLKVLLKHINSPIAVRSSGLFEDSVSESFSGVYQTFLIPNNHSSSDVRLEHLENAVKLVYASVFAPLSRSYFDAINYKVEEEKMAVVIQEVVGNLYGNRYYPDISGVAQSYNYYPISYMKPEDGIAIVAAGLGKYVIDGEKAYRFSPKYPKLDIITPEEQLKNSQGFFYAIDMNKSDINLIAGEDITLSSLTMDEAQKDGRLEYIASVWDHENNRINIGLSNPGPKIINFAYILKYDSFPLAKVLVSVLDMVRNSMGTPVEIEFAVDLNGKAVQGSNEMNGDKKPSFYLLQIKPLIRDYQGFTLNVEEINKEKLFLFTEQGMGNGKIEDIYDIIYCDPDKFDKSATLEMVSELDELNNKMKHENRKYILIGPGRWGTRDKWLGIPVAWSQISNAKIIVEADMKDFHVDASLGSHFFHHITSMNIGYFNVPYNSGSSFIDWDWLKSQRSVNGTKHFVHASFNSPLVVMMDGRKSVSVIYKG